MPSHEFSPKTTWIKLWIAWGAVVFVGVLIFRVLLSVVGEREAERYVGCQRHLRNDCQPSLFWVLAELKTGQDGAGTAVNNTEQKAIPPLPEPIETTEATSTKDYTSFYRDSDTAPVILSVTPGSTVLSEDGFYRGKPGSTIAVNAKVEDAKTVTLYYQWIASSAMPKKVAEMKKLPSGDYRASFTFPAANQLPGTLEVRAVNAKGETASLTLQIAGNQ